MQITDLTKEDLKIFLSYFIDFKMLKEIFSTTKNLRSKIKGFRIETIDKDILINKSIYLIRIEKNEILINFLGFVYNNYRNKIKEKEEYYEEQGLPLDVAHSLAITSVYKKEFLPIFFKLEEISEREQSKIISDYEKFNLFTTLVNNQFNDLFDKNLQKYISKLDLLEQKYDKLNNLYDKNFTKNNEELAKVLNEIKLLSKRIDNFETTNNEIGDLKREFDALKNNIEELIETQINSSEQSALLDTLRDDIKAIKTELATKTLYTNDISIQHITNSDFDSVDEYLSESIGDVIENIFSGEKFDCFREYLLEVIFSEKPIVTTSNNADKLAEIISSITCGGNYIVVDSNKIIPISELIRKLEDLSSDNNDNKVILVKSEIDLTNSYELVKFIKNRPFNEKYILKINFEGQLTFFPEESILDFNFYLGKIGEDEIEYRYYFDFINEKREPIKSNEFNNSLSLLGVNIDNYNLYNKNYYGLLSFSILPFLAINKRIDVLDLISGLLDHNIRTKCERAIDD